MQTDAGACISGQLTLCAHKNSGSEGVAALESERGGDPGEALGRAGSWVARTRPSMLDNRYIKEQSIPDPELPSLPSWRFRSGKERKNGRLYYMIKDGLTVHACDQIRFLTLTSSKDAPDDIIYSLKRLVQAARRVTPLALYSAGYLTKYAFETYYDDYEAGLKVEYCGCVTSEGNGVVHLLVAGDYIPVRWLRERWKEYHNSTQLVIKKLRPADLDRTSAYILGQYLSNQNGYVRGIHSRGWVYPGAKKDFKRLLRARVAEFGETVGYEIAKDEYARALSSRKSVGPSLDNEMLIAEEKTCRKAHRASLKGKYRWIPPSKRKGLVD